MISFLEVVWTLWGTVQGDLLRPYDGGILVRKTDLSGDWFDGSRLVDDSLSLDFHDMGSFLISEVRGVRITGNPRSNATYDHLEFKGIVRGCQSEE